MSKKKKIIIYAIVVLVFLAVIIGVYFLFKGESKDLTYGDFTVIDGGVGEVLDYDKSIFVYGYEASDQAYYITGNVRNNNQEENYQYVLLVFNLYDADNNLLGTATGALQSLNKNETKEFKALATIPYESIEQIDHYEINFIGENS